MIVRQFLHWTRNAPAGVRAEATAALARSFLYSDLSAEERAAAEDAMLTLLDDPSPLVRHALAEALADSPHAPPTVVHALAGDQPEIATVVLEHSLLFIDADLVEMVATGNADTQAAIARRVHLPRAVAAAIAEVGSAESCLILIENPDADVAQFSIDRIAERFGALAAIRESLLARHDLPASTRQALIAKLSGALADFVTARQWLDRGRAQRIVKEACEKATVTISAEVPDEARALVCHLRATAQLNVGLLLRALLSGNTVLFTEALSELSGVPLARVQGIVHDRGAASFRALYDKAGLPASTYPAFREAVAALREASYYGDAGGSRLKRRMIERVLRGCEQAEIGEIEPLLMLLRRFATEAAREEARLYCDELVAQEEEEIAFEAAQAREAAAEPFGYGHEVYDETAAAEGYDDAGAALQPGSTDGWPQVHYAAGEGPHFQLAHAEGELDYAVQDDPRDGRLAWQQPNYIPAGDDDAGYSAPPEESAGRGEQLDSLIEFYYQHLGQPAPVYPAFGSGRDPLMDYRPGQDRDDGRAQRRRPVSPDRYQRAAA
jgi:uncharacterized protein (DUF2336 family)